MALAGVLFSIAARAEVSQVRISQQYSMGYLQFDVMRHLGLLEKHAAALGLPDVKVTWLLFSGPDLINRALLAGQIDVAAGGFPGLLTGWAQTAETPQEIRGMAAMTQEPLLLNSRNLSVHSVRDFTAADRIAVPSILSVQALLLQMAAAREWGIASYGRLDSLTFSLSPPDATAGLLARRPDFDAAFTVPPYQYLQLRDVRIHTVLNSIDLVGDASGGLAWTTKRFHDENPRDYRAILDAMQEATDFITAHPDKAAAYFVADMTVPADLSLVRQLLADPSFGHGLTPRGTMLWANFMFKVGRIHRLPASWKDVFWPEVHHLDGN